MAGRTFGIIGSGCRHIVINVTPRRHEIAEFIEVIRLRGVFSSGNVQLFVGIMCSGA